MTKPWQLAVAVVAAVAVGLLGTSVVYGGYASDDLASGGPDRRPQDTGRTLQARAQTKRGAFGVLLYKNRGGQPCMAAGRVNGTVIGSGTGAEFVEMPLEDVGLCNLVPKPVAASVIQSPEETTVYGLAADDVVGLTVASGETVLKAVPAEDHAFIVNTSQALEGRVVVSATKRDGSSEELTIADLPDLAELSREVKAQAPASLAASSDWRP